MLKPDSPAQVLTTSQDNGGLTVTVLVPTYSGGAQFTITVERSDGENWNVYLPFPELDERDGPFRLLAENPLPDHDPQHDYYETFNGSVGLGAPDVPVEAQYRLHL